MLPIFAYFDPGAGSVLLQALVGGSAGLWVAVRYWWNHPRECGPQPLPVAKSSSSNTEIERRAAI